MINIEKIQEQVKSLQKCIDNHRSALCHQEKLSFKNWLYSYDELSNADDMAYKTSQTLIGQLKLMNIQTQDLLK